MKINLNNPFMAVTAMGGATFEPATNWWSQASEKNHKKFGNPFSSVRDAIYIPTLQKDGQPVAEEVVSSLKIQAAALGLTSITQAAGMWVLSETGEVQAETIWICYSQDPVAAEKRPALKALASTIKVLANQDDVAWEEMGKLNFTNGRMSSVEFDIEKDQSGGENLWIVPIADLESAEIRNILETAGHAVISFPGWWGMKWEEIPTGSQKEIQKFISENSVENIYGIKLTGESECEWSIKNIEPYRPGHQTALEAVAEISGIALSEHQRSVVVNTTSWIPGLKNLGLAQGIIDAIRLTDRASQGINPDQEAQAVRAWGLRTENERLTIVRLTHSKCAVITDRYYGQYTNLLILSEDGEVNFYGCGELCSKLQKKFAGWSGGAGLGQKGESAFWGGYPNHQKIQEFLD